LEVTRVSPTSRPLGRPAYGSIPHLPGSRLGPGDHTCEPGQAALATVRTRDRHDRVIVQEKLDGSCVAVARIGPRLVALTRAGYPARTSPYRQHHWFADWVDAHAARFFAVLADGERLAGEWLAQAHGTRYALPHEPFVAFDLLRAAERLPYDAFQARVAGRFVTPAVLHDGGAFPITAVQAHFAAHGSAHGALDPPEGAVWRVERQGRVLFVVKWVRPDKVDGAYLPQRTGRPPVWHWLPPNWDGPLIPTERVG
jgi:hypothetical protein